jgi:hypothetical protein
MASAKSGNRINSVAPADPDETYEADTPDPVAVSEFKAEQIEKGKGKYGETPAKPFKPSDDDNDDDEVETSWIEIELVDEDDNPVPGEKYEIELPDGSVASGTLDGEGFARVEGFEPGQCKISFPEYDKNDWDKA